MSRSEGKGSGRRAAPPPNTMAVRMLYGERAGQVVELPVEQAVKLLNGQVQRAEPVAVKPSDRAERR